MKNFRKIHVNFACLRDKILGIKNDNTLQNGLIVDDEPILTKGLTELFFDWNADIFLFFYYLNARIF